jgi:hypothetical protein
LISLRRKSRYPNVDGAPIGTTVWYEVSKIPFTPAAWTWPALLMCGR